MEIKKTSNLYFVLLVILVMFSQFLLLGPIIGQGFTHEDYVGLFKSRLYQEKFFTDPVNTWIAIGIHDAAHDFYIAFLDFLFGENYNMYLYTNIFFKVVATLLLYPLIFIISKSKSLAFLATLLYALSYPSTGALYLYVVGNEYIGVALMNLFLIVYYLSLKKNSYKLLSLASLLIFLSFMVSPIRVFPLFAIILIVEYFILIKDKLSRLFFSMIRILAIFLPILLFVFGTGNKSSVDTYGLSTIPSFFKLIIAGNWYLLLNPLWGLGHSLIPAPYFRIFGPIYLSSFHMYLISPFHLLLVLMGLLSSFLLSNKPYKFFLKFVLIDLVLQGVLFLLLTHHLTINPKLIQEYNPVVFLLGQYAGILAIFVISISISCFLEYFSTGRKNNLFLLIFLSPLISLIFISGQWFFTQQQFMYQGAIHRYLVIPQIGLSLFLATYIIIAYQKKGGVWIIAISCLIILTTLLFSKSEIERGFYIKRDAGEDLQAQESMKSQVLKNIPAEKIRQDLLFYIKLSKGPQQTTPYENAFDWHNLFLWMHIKKSYITDGEVNGCVVLIWGYSELRKMAKVQNQMPGFIYKDGGEKEGMCFKNGEPDSLDGKFFGLDQFYAFSVEGKYVRNITPEIITTLSFTPVQ